MERLVQTRFAHPDPAVASAEHPLVIHQRTDPTQNASLLVFVHGLGGSRYGRASTWGDFPVFLYEDLPGIDVGMYHYHTLAGRFGSGKSVALEDEARVFADLVRDQLRDYRDIVLIGHSMGGLLCKAVIHRLIETGDDASLDRIKGLLLMATPQLGSLRMPAFLSAFSHDARALQPHGDFVTRINRTFEDRVALDEKIITYRRTTIPTWAVEAVGDRWVDSLSAGIGLVSSRRKVVRGTHTSIVKPSSRNSDVYGWVRQRIAGSLQRFKYDVFVAAAMAGHAGDAEYDANRRAVLALVETLQRECGFESVFYAGTRMPTQADFDPRELALKVDLEALRQSRNFILYYPEKIVSSVLYEAGWALILGKPAIYIVRDDRDLPFLLKEAQQAFAQRMVRIFECADEDAMLERVAAYGERLFRFRAEL